MRILDNIAANLFNFGIELSILYHAKASAPCINPTEKIYIAYSLSFGSFLLYKYNEHTVANINVPNETSNDQHIYII
jgi:hypothetical protein